MGCNMKKILMIGLVISILIGLAFVPSDKQSVKAGYTITITFDPDGNVSLDVSPATYAFGTLYANSSEGTTATYFTIWNNGSMDDMQTDLQINTSPAALTVDEDSVPAAMDNYALWLDKGTVSSAEAWCKESDWIELDSDLDTTGTETFGFTLYIYGISANHSQQTLVIDLTGH